MKKKIEDRIKKIEEILGIQYCPECGEEISKEPYHNYSCKPKPVEKKSPQEELYSNPKYWEKSR